MRHDNDEHGSDTLSQEKKKTAKRGKIPILSF